MKQLTIFDKEEIITKKEIKEKLSKYSIDKIYQNEFLGKTTLLREIYEKLSKQKDYKDYMNDLINELLKYVPLIEQNITKKETGIFKYDNGIYGYKTTAYESGNVKYNGCSCPLYCVDMLPNHFFEGVD